MRVEDDRGAVAVEFAIIAPLLLLVIFMVFDAGRYWFVQIGLVNATSQAARSLANGGTAAAAQSIMNQAAASALSLSQAPSMATTANVCALSGGERWASATASLNFVFLSPVGWFLRINPNSTATDSIAVSSDSRWVCPAA
jgi:Flp pilus assembly protein TadG